MRCDFIFVIILVYGYGPSWSNVKCRFLKFNFLMVLLSQSPLIYTKEMHRITTVLNRQFFRQFSSTKDIVPYTPPPLATATALSNLPLLNDAIHYLTTAPSQKNTDIIYHVMDADDRFLDISIYKDFKQNQHFFRFTLMLLLKGLIYIKRQLKKSNIRHLH